MAFARATAPVSITTARSAVAGSRPVLPHHDDRFSLKDSTASAALLASGGFAYVAAVSVDRPGRKDSRPRNDLANQAPDRRGNASANLHLGARTSGARWADQGQDHRVDSTTLEANAAMKSIVRRDTGENYTAYLKRLAEVEGVDATDAAALRRMDRKRAKKTSNEDWISPSDAAAEITKLKDGRTALAYKAENAVDMETGAIVAVTTHGGASSDPATVKDTVIEAGLAVAGLIAEKTLEGKYEVHPGGVEEVVADKGYHSNDVAVGLAG